MSGELFQALITWRDAEAKVAEARGEKMFMGKPDAWFDEPHWFCINGHVSGTFLKCEVDGDRCLACHERVILGPTIGERDFAPVIAGIRQGLLARATLQSISTANGGPGRDGVS